jgi:hypothetical protein
MPTRPGIEISRISFPRPFLIVCAASTVVGVAIHAKVELRDSLSVGGTAVLTNRQGRWGWFWNAGHAHYRAWTFCKSIGFKVAKSDANP